MNKAAKKYYQTIYRLFPDHSIEERHYLVRFKEYIRLYDQLHPDTTYEQYIEKFGEPQDVVSSYYVRIDNSIVISKMKSQKFIKSAICIFLVSFIILAMSFIYIRYNEYKNEMDDQPYYYETTIYSD